jgi:hypothetical protein
VAVQIGEVEVVPSAPALQPADNATSQDPAAAPRPGLEHEVERAARLLRSRDLRVHAD